MSAASSTSPAKPRPWRQFSLRAVLVAILLCCVGLMLWNIYIEPYRRQQKILADITKLGGQARTEAVPTRWGEWLFGDRFFFNVVQVDLNNAKVDDTWMVRIRHLPRLRSLSIGATGVGDAGLAHLAELRDLRELLVSGPRVTDAGMAYLKDLTYLEGLFAGQTAITDAGLAHLRDHTLLKQLDLQACNITDVGVGHLERMSDLLSLDLRNTHISDTGIARVAPRKQLSRLLLDNTDVTEASLVHFQQLPALTEISLAGTHIIPSALREALPGLADRNVAQKLRDPTNLGFVRTPLGDVVDYLKDYHRMEIVLDARSLGTQGRKTPITAKIKDQSLETALGEVLTQRGLTAGVHYGFLMIASQQDERSYLRRLALKPGEKLSREFSQALYAQAAVSYVKAPLTMVFDDLSQRHGVACRIDGDAWTREAEPRTVNCNLYGGIAANVVELILDQFDLHGVIENNTVLVRPGPLPPYSYDRPGEGR